MSLKKITGILVGAAIGFLIGYLSRCGAGSGVT